jgi:hypothetical protein
MVFNSSRAQSSKSGESLWTLRALTVLEHAGTPESDPLIKRLVEGARGAGLPRKPAACRGAVGK